MGGYGTGERSTRIARNEPAPKNVARRPATTRLMKLWALLVPNSHVTCEDEPAASPMQLSVKYRATKIILRKPPKWTCGILKFPAAARYVQVSMVMVMVVEPLQIVNLPGPFLCSSPLEYSAPSTEVLRISINPGPF